MNVEAHFWLNMLFSWEGEQANLYKCVTTIFPNRKDPSGSGKITVNHAAQSYADVERLIDSQSGWREAGVYMSLGMQNMASTEVASNGFVKAIRRGNNMAGFKCLFLDIDAKDHGNDPAAVNAALQAFLTASYMPAPSMLVRSGSGGVHVYWCFDTLVDTKTWQQLADALKRACEYHKLKCDPAVTADAARVLRVPGTLNHKTNPPTLVTLDTPDAVRIYTVATLTGVLHNFMQASKAKAQAATGGGSVSSAWGQNFQGGVDEKSFPPLPIDQIAINCPMTAATLADGGAGKDEPAWSNDMYLAAFTSDPTDAAHRLSKGHDDYDPAETDKKLAEKQAAIAAGMGWPRCKIFTHAACQTCPLRAQDKGPIQFAHMATPKAQPMQPKPQADNLMPEGYWRNANDYVFTNGQFGTIDVLGYPILDGGIDPTDGALVLKTHVSGKDRWGSMHPSKLTDKGICELLAKGTGYGILVRNNEKAVKTFVMAWMTHLQQVKTYIQPVGFGWTGKDFVFGDEKFTPTGPVAAYRGNTIDTKYQRHGELQPWTDALALVKGNPALEIVVASAFAAPLVSLACDYSPTLSVFSHNSGFGKSTAMKIAQAVWGKPREGMSMLDDTENSVNQKTSALKHLPIYWDEMKTKEQIEKLVRVVFATAQGRSKARLDRDSRQKDIGSATTLLIVASNHGIASAVYRATEGTDAGGLRVFEVEVPPLVTSVSASTSETRIIKLNENYGVAGALYADFIVKNRAAIEQILSTISDDLDRVFSFAAKERFWKNTMVTLLAGANIANAMGLTAFDIPAMQAHLYESLRALRMGLTNQSYTLAGPQAGLAVLSEMMSDIRAKHMVITDIVPPQSMGRPPPVRAIPMADQSREDIWMQMGETDGRILVRQHQFNEWLAKRKQQPEHIIKLLRQDYTIINRKATIGAGVPYLDVIKLQANCYDMTPHVPPAPPVSHNPSSPSATPGF